MNYLVQLSSPDRGPNDEFFLDIEGLRKYAEIDMGYMGLVPA
jgi:hypothetical protein